MKKNFFQRLQQVKIKDIFHVLLFVLSIIPAFLYKIAHKPFWLISDYEMEARDNGFFFYKYMTENQPEQVVWYAINKKSPDFEKVKPLGKVVSYGGLMHWILYLAAQVNISSQKGGKPNAAVCYALEVSGLLKNKRVFLQHGIIKDDLPYVHYNNARFSLFTTSVQREYEFVNDTFGYPQGVVRQLGLCRYDYLRDESRNEKILVMPTWRQWIAHRDYKAKDVEAVDGFKETLYCKKWSELLKSEQLYDLLDRYNKRLIFYPHRNMQEYAGEFDIQMNKRIEIAKWPEYDVHQLIKECDILITDYSSVAMDFSYLNKPVLYYQFDYEQFRKNHMEEGYFNYTEDGFGEVCYELNILLENLDKYIKNDFKMEEKYAKRVESFFDLKDRDNCKRTYEAVREII